MKTLLWLAVAAAIPAMAQDGKILAVGRPANAGVFIDGKYVGPASRFTVPERYAVPPGEHEVSLRDPRCEDFTTKVTVAAKKKTKIKYSLKKLPEPQGPFGTLRFGGDGDQSFMSVTAGDTGAVFLNDKFYGYIDELNNKGSGLLLPPGTYKLRVENSQFNMNREVSIEANKITQIPLAK
jgi:hypothetical protein